MIILDAGFIISISQFGVVLVVDCVRNAMAHTQKPVFVFRRKDESI